MAIHHATVKSAAKFGIILTETECEGVVYAQALWSKNNYRIVHRDPKEAVAAVRLQQTFVGEYPAITLDHADDVYEVSTKDPDDPQVILAMDTLPTIADVLDACAEFGVDPEEGYDEETPVIVVPNWYKEEYAARGNRNHCGDWLAGFLDGRFADGEGHFDADEFAAFLKVNGVDMTGKWADLPNSDTRGWQGRYRMNGRQKLEVRVATVGGVTLLDGTFVKAPVEYLEELIGRHPKVTPEWNA